VTTLVDLLQVNEHLTAVHVERWIARGLLRPSGEAETWSFEPVDVARARLLAELVDDIGLDDDTVEAMVALIDQVHTLRQQLHLLSDAVGEQPAEARSAIAGTLKRLAARS
jgi:chaperone modulatory protein CbpM